MFAAGVLTLENGFPITLGANIGTTITAILAAMAADKNAGLTIALVHGSDLEIVEALGKRGLRVARRTVAKYREAMNIPSSSERTVNQVRKSGYEEHHPGHEACRRTWLQEKSGHERGENHPQGRDRIRQIYLSRQTRLFTRVP